VGIYFFIQMILQRQYSSYTIFVSGNSRQRASQNTAPNLRFFLHFRTINYSISNAFRNFSAERKAKWRQYYFVLQIYKASRYWCNCMKLPPWIRRCLKFHHITWVCVDWWCQILQQSQKAVIEFQMLLKTSNDTVRERLYPCKLIWRLHRSRMRR